MALDVHLHHPACLVEAVDAQSTGQSYPCDMAAGKPCAPLVPLQFRDALALLDAGLLAEAAAQWFSSAAARMYLDPLKS